MLVGKECYERILDNLYDGLYLTDMERRIFYWNRAAERITGFKADEVVGKRCSDNILTHIDKSGHSLCMGICPMALSINDGNIRETEVFLHHKNGHRIPVSIRVSSLTDANGKITGGVELFSDISNVKAIEQRVKELEEIALLDNLTKLANRHHIENEIGIRFEEMKRTGISFGIILVDIDHFKKFNDEYGHDTGDRVLKFVAETLSRNSRPFDLTGRWGGEEFMIVVRNVTPEYLEEIGNRLRILAESSYITVGEKKLNVCISLGATIVRPDDSAETLFKRADELLYTSKKAGRNRLTIG